MGYAGLDSYGCSDEASDMSYEPIEAMVESLESHLDYVTNEYNTDGFINIALFYEAFIIPGKTFLSHAECGLNELAEKVIAKLESAIESMKKEEDWEDKDMHLKAYKRMKKSLSKFIKDSKDY